MWAAGTQAPELSSVRAGSEAEELGLNWWSNMKGQHPKQRLTLLHCKARPTSIYYQAALLREVFLLSSNSPGDPHSYRLARSMHLTWESIDEGPSRS